jgi:DNA-directed RNA polymerase subunit RPC12/RpoP
MAGRFDFDSRVLMCGNCGGPLQTGHTGGNVTCDYCGTVSVFTPRREDPVEPVAAVSNMSEEERIALLNRQDGSPPAIPAAVSQLLSRGADWLPGRRARLLPCGGPHAANWREEAISAAPNSSTSSP